jgi:hypothetical protein
MSAVDSDETQLSEDYISQNHIGHVHDDLPLELHNQISPGIDPCQTHSWKHHAETSHPLQVHLLKRQGHNSIPFVFFEVPESGSECVPSNDVVTQIKALEVYGW